MEKVYWNILANNSRYTKMMILLTLFILVMITGMVVISFKNLSGAEKAMSSGEYEKLEKKTKNDAILHIVFGGLTAGMAVFIGWSKKKARIATSPLGIRQDTVFKKTFIPWDQVRDVKIKMPGTSAEKCLIKGKEDNIIFDAYFLDTSLQYRITGSGIFDEHDNPVTGKIRKSRLYKDVSSRVKV